MSAGQTNAGKPPLSLSFHNFWPEFDTSGSYFERALAERYDVSVDPVGRDVQISSVFGTAPLPKVPGHRPLRVWFTSETRDPYAQIFDLYFGFRPRTALLGDRWHRFPLWAAYLDWWDDTSPFHAGRLTGPRAAGERAQFCNFIYSADPSIRGEFFLRLNDARPVNSFGRALNNAGALPHGREAKLAILEQSLFTIAFENEIAAGYVTEKLVEPLMAGSIPIYWGAEEAKSDFNPAAFIHAEDFASMDDLIAYVIGVADDPAKLAGYQTAPPFAGHRFPHAFKPQFFADRISDALDGDRPLRDHWPARWKAVPRHRELKRRLRAFRRGLLGQLAGRR